MSFWIRYFPKTNKILHLKMWYTVLCAIAIGIASEKAGFLNSKFIASLTLGITLQNVWGDHKPILQLRWFQWFVSPLFFGTVGGVLNFNLLRK